MAHHAEPLALRRRILHERDGSEALVAHVHVVVRGQARVSRRAHAALHPVKIFQILRSLGGFLQEGQQREQAQAHAAVAVTPAVAVADPHRRVRGRRAVPRLIRQVRGEPAQHLASAVAHRRRHGRTRVAPAVLVKLGRLAHQRVEVAREIRRKRGVRLRRASLTGEGHGPPAQRARGRVHLQAQHDRDTRLERVQLLRRGAGTGRRDRLGVVPGHGAQPVHAGALRLGQFAARGRKPREARRVVPVKAGLPAGARGGERPAYRRETGEGEGGRTNHGGSPQQRRAILVQRFVATPRREGAFARRRGAHRVPGYETRIHRQADGRHPGAHQRRPRPLRQRMVAAAHLFRRPQPRPVRLHRLLPARDFPQEDGLGKVLRRREV